MPEIRERVLRALFFAVPGLAISIALALFLWVHPLIAAQEPTIELEENKLSINGITIQSLTRPILDAVLGKPDRIEQRGTNHVFDDLGISYWAHSGSDTVTSLTLYLKKSPYSHSPRKQFSGTLTVAGKVFPLDKPIKGVMEAVPEVKPLLPDLKFQGPMFKAVMGIYALSVSNDVRADEIQQIAISIPRYIPDAKNEPDSSIWSEALRMPEGSGIEPPVLRESVKPEYTDEARDRKVQGTVVLEVVILKDGTVGPIRVLKSLDRGLDLNAIWAVRKWSFQPGTLDGKPVDVLAEFTVDFRLK